MSEERDKQARAVREAGWEGRDAFMEEGPKDNPYPPDSPEADAWDEGWTEAWDYSRTLDAYEAERES